MAESQYDILVIGAGPAGYTAAIRAAQLGFKTACVETRTSLGGTCLNVGCVPSKALLESSALYEEIKTKSSDHGLQLEAVRMDTAAMMARKEKVVGTIVKGVDFLFKKYNVDRILGSAEILVPGRVQVTGETIREITCDRMILATGSRPKILPGIAPDGDRIGDSTAALSYSDVPKSLAVIGGGAVGLELGSVWRRLGAEVTVLEFLDSVLPGLDADIVKQAARFFKRQKLQIRTGVRVLSAAVEGDQVRIEIEGAEPVYAERLLYAAGRTPNTDSLGLERTRVQTDVRGFIDVNDRYETAEPGIFAVGDAIGGILLAHKASEEAVRCVERIAGLAPEPLNPLHIPAVVYTSPEIAAVGRTEAALLQENIPYVKGESFFKANARAHGHGTTDGSVKVLAHRQTEALLGVHIIGPYAGELIAEAVLAIRAGLSVEAVAHTCHAHPTLSETLREAAEAALAESRKR